VDPILLLTPLLALAVVGLLGFTGCDDIFDLEEVKLPDPTATLLFQLRAPSTIELPRREFRYIAPGATGPLVADGPTERGEGTDTLYESTVPDAMAGDWTVTCGVVGRRPDGSVTLEREGTCTFTLDPASTPELTVKFVTVSAPGAGGFGVECRGTEVPP
jgi:hypothetical protein